MAIAGIDGAGKSTLGHGLRRLYERELGPCVVAEQKDDFAIQMANAAAAKKRMTARQYFGNFPFDFAKSFDIVRDHFVRIEPLLQSGVSVIVPRSVECRVALAMSRGSESIEKIASILDLIPRADVTIRLRIDPSIACTRVLLRGVDEESVEDLEALSKSLDEIQANRDDWIEVCAQSDKEDLLHQVSDLLFSRVRSLGIYA